MKKNQVDLGATTDLLLRLITIFILKFPKEGYFYESQVVSNLLLSI